MRPTFSSRINTTWRRSVALALLLVLPGCRPTKPASRPDPFGPIRSIQEIRQAAPALAGQVVRLRGRIGSVRDLNPGMPFPWDVVYTLEDNTGSIPVHWLSHEQRPKEIKPPALAARVIKISLVLAEHAAILHPDNTRPGFACKFFPL